MRTTRDRIRHTISFEILGLLIATPLGALVFDLPLADVLVVGIATSLAAALWNYAYNLGFDHALTKLTGDLRKGLTLRVLHAVLFEAGLTLMLMPFIALYLGIGLLQALVMDVGFALFYMGYAFVFNLGYDWLFPLSRPRTDAQPISSA